MTLRLFSGFDHTSGNDLFAGVIAGVAATANYAVAPSLNTAFGGKSLQISTSDPLGAASAGYAMLPLPAITTTLIAGVSINLSSAPQGGYDFGITNGFSCHIFCRFILDQVFVYLGDPVNGGYTLLDSATTGLLSSGWSYLELEATIGTASSGSVAIYINGQSVLNRSGITTSIDGTSSIAGVALGVFDVSGGGFQGYFDDLYVIDTFGPPPNNTRLGPVRVLTRFPTANSATTFTPIAYTNWLEVADTSMDLDGSYNYSNTSSATDLFVSFPIPITTTEIFATQIKAAVRKDDAGTRSMATVVASAGVQATGATNPLSPAYRYIGDIYSTDPATGSSWTVGAINASTFGYTIVN